jgi:hypothetical protein
MITLYRKATDDELITTGSLSHSPLSRELAARYKLALESLRRVKPPPKPTKP